MVKKFVKSMLALGLLLSVPQFSLRSEGPSAQQMVDFESYLQPHDLALLEQDGEMVFIPFDVINLVKGLSSDVQAVKDLADHVNMGYIVAPMADVSVAIEHMMKTVKPNTQDCSILTDYQTALSNGEALIRTQDMSDRRRNKCGRFCTLFVRNCATVGCLNVRNDASVCGNLDVNGTVSASNFVFTGFTGGFTNCQTTFRTPNISSCGNIIFNTSGTNALNAQGAFEARMRLIRGTVSLSGSAIGLVPTAAAGISAPVTVNGTLPTASITAGSGANISGAVTATAFSSGIVVPTSVAGTLEYSFAVDVRIPVSFNPAYSAAPSIILALQNLDAVITTTTAIVDANTATDVQVAISNVLAGSALINIIFHVTAQGTTYALAATNAANAVNNIISTVGTNALLVNLFADGRVA